MDLIPVKQIAVNGLKINPNYFYRSIFTFDSLIVESLVSFPSEIHAVDHR